MAGKARSSTPSGANPGRKIDEIINRNRPTDRRYDLEILQALRRIIRATDIYSRKLRATHDLTAPQLICLLAIVEDGPLTATLLAQRVHLSPSTVVGILDRLESKGLVTRTRSEKDRRVLHLASTPKSRRLARHAPSPLQENLTRALDKLPAREQHAICSAIERLVELMEITDVDAAPILDTGDLQE